MQKHILSIGYGRQLFQEGNGERDRLRLCAAAVPSLHQIVFSRSSHGLIEERVSEQFFLVPTNSRASMFMILDAIRLGRRIIRSSPPGTAWCVTSQDPLGAGIAGYFLAKFVGCPFVVQEHGDIFSGLYWRSESWKNRMLYSIARLLVVRADRVRAVSLRVKGHLVALGVSEKKISVLPVFSDLSSVVLREPDSGVRALFPDASLTVLSVGRFVLQKNLSLLLSAFAALRKVHPGARLVLVGEGPLRGRLEKESEVLGIAGALCIVSWTHDVISFMKTADIYALSSNYEGWARVLPEAMAAGLPGVTTEVGCVGEVFLHGAHGVVVPVGDSRAFADALIALANDGEKRAAYSARAARDAAQVFSGIASYADEWAALFAEGESGQRI